MTADPLSSSAQRAALRAAWSIVRTERAKQPAWESQQAPNELAGRRVTWRTPDVSRVNAFIRACSEPGSLEARGLTGMSIQRRAAPPADAVRVPLPSAEDLEQAMNAAAQAWRASTTVRVNTPVNLLRHLAGWLGISPHDGPGAATWLDAMASSGLPLRRELLDQLGALERRLHETPVAQDQHTRAVQAATLMTELHQLHDLVSGARALHRADEGRIAGLIPAVLDPLDDAIRDALRAIAQMVTLADSSGFPTSENRTWQSAISVNR